MCLHIYTYMSGVSKELAGATNGELWQGEKPE